jgi:hypothetical protein
VSLGILGFHDVTRLIGDAKLAVEGTHAGYERTVARMYANGDPICENSTIKVKADDSLDVMIKPVI